MALIFIQIENCLIELWFAFESKIVRYMHVNNNENGSVRARMDLMDFDSNLKLVYEMVPIGSYWFLFMVRINGMHGTYSGNELSTCWHRRLPSMASAGD